MSRSAILSIRVVSDTKGARKGLEETATGFDKFERGLNRASKVAAGVAGGLLVLGKRFETIGEASASADARIAHIIDNMGLFGDQAGKVSDRLVDTAENMARITGIDPNVIKQAQASLATFEDIAITADELGGVFDRATEASADLSAAGFGSVESASIMLGKALNDPKRGLTALTRVGVAFSDQQRDQIEAMVEAGDMAGAQEAILAAVERQVGGTAAATADASDQMRVAWQLTQEEIAKKLLPTFERARELGAQMADWVGENSDLVITLAKVIGGGAAAILGLNAAIKTVRTVSTVFNAVSSAGGATVRTVQNFVSGMRSASAASSSFTGVAGTLGGGLRTLVTTIGQGAVAAGRWVVQTTILTAKLIAQRTAQIAISVASKAAAAAQWLWNAAANANPLLLIITLVVAAITLLIMNWDKVKAVALKVWDAIKVAGLWLWDNVLQPVADWIAETFGPVWETLRDIAVAVWEGIQTAAQWLWENVLQPIGEWIADNFVQHWEILKLAAELAWQGITAAAQWLWENVLQPVADWIASTFIANWERLKSAGTAVWDAIRNGGQTLWNLIQRVASWIVGTFVGNWERLKSAGTAVWDAIRNGGQTLWNLIQRVARFVTGTLSTAWNTLRSAGVNAFNAILTPIRTIWGWLQDIWGLINDVIGGIGNALGSLFGFAAAPAQQPEGATATAAFGPGARPPALRGPGINAQQNVNINVTIPNYVGTREELVRWLKDALKRADIETGRLIRA